MLAQINLAFEEKYLPKAASNKLESTLKLSQIVLDTTKLLMPLFQPEIDSVYGIFFKKMKLMNQFAEHLAQHIDLVPAKGAVWQKVFNHLVDESLPYSRDGRPSLISHPLRVQGQDLLRFDQSGRQGTLGRLREPRTRVSGAGDSARVRPAARELQARAAGLFRADRRQHRHRQRSHQHLPSLVAASHSER